MGLLLANLSYTLNSRSVSKCVSVHAHACCMCARTRDVSVCARAWVCLCARMCVFVNAARMHACMWMCICAVCMFMCLWVCKPLCFWCVCARACELLCVFVCIIVLVHVCACVPSSWVCINKMHVFTFLFCVFACQVCLCEHVCQC